MGYFVRLNKHGLLCVWKKTTTGLSASFGVALMVFPYFVSNVWLSIVIGIALMALPFFI